MPFNDDYRQKSLYERLRNAHELLITKYREQVGDEEMDYRLILEERENVTSAQRKLIWVGVDTIIKAQNSFSDRIRNVYDIIMHIYKELDEEESVMFRSLIKDERKE